MTKPFSPVVARKAAIVAESASSKGGANRGALRRVKYDRRPDAPHVGGNRSSVLHERDPRSIVDADMDELPTDAVVTVDGARISSGDVVPDGADPAELFDIEMDELARMLGKRFSDPTTLTA